MPTTFRQTREQSNVVTGLGKDLTMDEDSIKDEGRCDDEPVDNALLHRKSFSFLFKQGLFGRKQ